jgi:uncharacterized FlaG/YvyC family protein
MKNNHQQVKAMNETKDQNEQREFLIKELVDAEKSMTAALDRMTEAIKYLANVMGFAVDKSLAEAGIAAKDAHPGLTVNHEIPADEALKQSIKAPKQPPAQPQGEAPAPPAEPNLETVRAAMNAFAKREGKTAAMALIDRYCKTRKVEDVPPERYGDLLLEAA